MHTTRIYIRLAVFFAVLGGALQACDSTCITNAGTAFADCELAADTTYWACINSGIDPPQTCYDQEQADLKRVIETTLSIKPRVAARETAQLLRRSRVLVLFYCVRSIGVAELRCMTTLPEQKRSELAKYVAKKYRLSSSVNVKLASVKGFNDTCYRELLLEGTSPVNTWRLALYLSPDQRFLTDELFDTTIDPREEERRKAESLMSDLVQNKGASKGPETAPVTIVAFSDFQCPYCRRLADILREVAPEEKSQVRIVFHHLPLSIHPWARSAAE